MASRGFRFPSKNLAFPTYILHARSAGQFVLHTRCFYTSFTHVVILPQRGAPRVKRVRTACKTLILHTRRFRRRGATVLFTHTKSACICFTHVFLGGAPWGPLGPLGGLGRAPLGPLGRPLTGATWAPWDQGPGPGTRDQGSGPGTRAQGPGPGTSAQGPGPGPGTRARG